MKMLLMLLTFGLPLFAQAENIQIQLKPEAELSQPVEDTFLSYDFGAVWVNTPRSIVYSITAGDTESRFREILYSGAAYRVITNCPVILPPKQVCDVRITFAPMFPGLHTGRVVMDLYTQRFIVDLWGQGISR